MATVGSIAAVFSADTKGLKKGIDDSISYFEKLQDQIDEITEAFENFSDDIKKQTKAAQESVESLGRSARVVLEVDTTGAMRNIAAVRSAAESVQSVSTNSNAAIAAAPQQTAQEAAAPVEITANAEPAIQAIDRTHVFFDSFFSMVSERSQSFLSGFSNAAQGVADAARGLQAGLSSVTDGFNGFFVAADRVIVAVGRTLGSFESVTGIVTAVGVAVGGFSTVMAAAAGSTAAASVAVGTLAASIAGAVSGTAAYSAVMSLASALTAGMSEEAREYVREWAAIPATAASVSAQLAVSAATFRIVASAIYRSTSAADFFNRVFAGVIDTMGAVGRSISFLTRTLGTLVSITQIAGAAADEHLSFTGFLAAVARIAATTAAFGAVGGAITSLASGGAALTGAIAGASGALGTLVAAFPLTATLATAAAVATGKFAHELEELSVAFQKTDQMASRFGATTAEMQKLEIAAANTMVSMGQLGKAQQTFFTNLSKIRGGQMNVESVREAKLAFDRLGISVEEIKNSNPREIFAEVAEAVGSIEDPADRSAAAFDLFGKQGAAIVPALKEFGELEKDFARIGGATPQIDVKRWLDVETSFDRMKASSQALGSAMLLPFVELQKGLNNLKAELTGGLVPAFGAIGSLIADVTKPVAVILEVFGRVLNIIGRIVGVFVSLAASLSWASTIAVAFDQLAQGINDILGPIEDVVGIAEEIAAAFADFLRPTIDSLAVLFRVSGENVSVFRLLGQAVGVIVGALTVLTGLVVGGAAAWVVYTLAVNTSIAAMVRFAVTSAIAWVAALGPLGIALALMAGVGAAMYALVSYAAPLAKLFTRIGTALGFVGEEAEKFDAAKASVQELAEVAAEAGAGDVRELTVSLSQSRGELDDLIITAAKFGQAGSDAAAQAQKQYRKLEQQLADGKLTAEEFDAAVARNADTLEENLRAYRDDSPEITLKKNLELYKSLDDAVKSAGKSVRDLSAGTVVDKKLFPTSEAIKASAETFKNEYAQAIEAIKKKQQSGGFAKELADQAKELEDQLANGEISTGEFNTRKMSLDASSAQEEAQKAAEDVKRTFDRQMEQIGKDVSFATDIRKQLEDAFLSPVEKYEKKLKEIRDNKSLTPEEKTLAEKNLRKEGREQIIGKTAGEKFQDRQRDLLQASRAGLIKPEEMTAEMLKNSNEIASSLGAVVNPARVMEVALINLDEALNSGAINAETFASGMKNARDKFLESLGIDKQQTEKDNERLAELQKQFDAGKITKDEFGRGQAAIGNEIFGKSQAQQFAEQEARIRNAMANGTDGGRGDAALRKLSLDRLQAAGLEASPAAKLQAQVDKIDDAFGLTGMSARDAAAKLAKMPGATDAYRRAIEKANKSIIDSYGVNKTPMESFSSGLDSIRDKFGVTGKTIEESRNQLRGNAQALALFDRAVKDSRDSLLQTLGVEKSPAQVFEEQMKKIEEAASKPVAEGGLTAQEAAKARAEAMKKRDEALGGESTSGFFNEYARKKSAIEEAYGVGGSKDKEKYDNALRNLNKGLPGMDKESPVAEFQRNLDKLAAVFGTGSKEFNEGKLNLQAQLQEELRPLAGRLTPDRRSIESADSRSKAGVDTFFRILRGRDNPSLKAQLDTARNTRILADAANNDNARPLLVQLAPR